jgi:hypothetical protein
MASGATSAAGVADAVVYAGSEPVLPAGEGVPFAADAAAAEGSRPDTALRRPVGAEALDASPFSVPVVELDAAASPLVPASGERARARVSLGPGIAVAVLAAPAPAPSWPGLRGAALRDRLASSADIDEEDAASLPNGFPPANLTPALLLLGAASEPAPVPAAAPVEPPLLLPDAASAAERRLARSLHTKHLQPPFNFAHRQACATGA